MGPLSSWKKLDTLLGWGVGLIALIVYVLTIEPTAGYWDCGEFVAVSHKLEVPHPPGAPLYLLLGRFFSFFAAGKVVEVAYWVNMLSVVSSALTIVFLFWSITILGRRLLPLSTEREGKVAQYTVFGAGVLGAMCFTFSDSFWFSAVEAEVYGLSSLFTAVLFWAALRWGHVRGKALQWQWIICISYIIGLSIGVHLLGLVVLPAITLAIYFEQYKGRVNVLGSTLAVMVGVVIMGFIMVGVIQGLPSLAIDFDITFVNHLGLPFYSGIICFVALFFGVLTFGIVYTQRKKWGIANGLLLSLLFLLLGYSSYTLILIRSGQNPPIDENNPEDALKFLSYLKREQYGSRPLLYGHHFAASLLKQEKGSPIYRQKDEAYHIVEWNVDPVFAKEDNMLLPRMYSTRHKRAYRRHLGLRAQEKPTSWDNVRFLFNYQIGHMYVRYFMWNFAGRASDEPNANWLSPVRALRKNVPSTLADNKARNHYWLLPFFFGLLGLFFQAKRDYQGFSLTMIVFLLTGLGLVFYLNMPPGEPRERDYIYAGSYYAFAIWIGLSFIALERGFRRLLQHPATRLAVCSLVALCPVVLMAKENWDDHDRSERYFSVDSAKNLLNSCQKNAILFTGGDNDTFPLWYAQEVEGIRTDVRVIVLSYFNTDWYIGQMMRPAYDSPVLPFTLDESQYAQGGRNDILYVQAQSGIKGAISLERYLDLIRKKDPRILVNSSLGTQYNMIPAKVFAMEVDTTNLTKDVVPAAFDSLRTDIIYIALSGKHIEKKDLAVLDLISAQDWARPIYFNHTSLRGINMDLSPYVIQEGLAYRFAPVLNTGGQTDDRLLEEGLLLDTERMYENVMKRFSFRGLQDEEIYLSGDYRNFVHAHRASLSSLAGHLYRKGDTLRAKEVLYHSFETMPDKTVPYDRFGLPTLAVALFMKEKALAVPLADNIVRRAEEWILYLGPSPRRDPHIRTIKEVARRFAQNGYLKEADRYLESIKN